MSKVETANVLIKSEIDQIVSNAETVVATDDELLAFIARGIRSSLRSRKVAVSGSLYSESTNCVGALLQLQSAARDRGVEKEIQPVYVRRFPWQHQDAAYNIHIAGIAPVNDVGLFRYIDPTPVAGYLYGQTSLVDRSYRIEDSDIQGFSELVPLLPSEFDAIQGVYLFESGEITNDEADTLLDVLDVIPAYKARLAVKLFQKTGAKKYLSIITAMPVGSLRRSYHQYVNNGGVHQHELFSHEDTAVRCDVARVVDALLKSEKDDIKGAHLLATSSQISGAVSQGVVHPLDMNGSIRPVFDYETDRMKNGPATMTSNSYYYVAEGIR